jgi:transcriptional regulator with PAS, ATPase and Fis domain
LANGGTLFLDEITELDMSLQAKLLRVIQERQFRRIGGQKMIRVDIRIISAANRNPELAVKQNRLRQDLFYRLHVVPIVLPPLRERKEDIPFLLSFFLNKYCRIYKLKSLKISAEAMKVLKSTSGQGMSANCRISQSGWFLSATKRSSIRKISRKLFCLIQARSSRK